MQVYDHPTFQMACQQFDLVADHLQIPASDRERLKFPKRSLTVALPVHMDDGSTKVFLRLPRCSIISRSARRKAACAIIPT